MKKVIFWAALFISAVLGAQTIHEPNSEIYRDIERWSVQGYIKDFLPLVRPYPAPLVDRILNDVIENGDSASRARAQMYLDMVGPDSAIIHPGAEVAVEGKNSESGITAAVIAEGLFRLEDYLSVGYHFSYYALTDQNGERFNVPGTYTPYPDFVWDRSSIGSIELRNNWTSLIALGSDDVYFQAGLSRSSVGPFYDNGIVLGPQAPRAGHFSFVFRQPLWSFEMLFQTLTASDDFGQNRFPEKFSVIHSYNLHPWQNLELGFLQAVIWGERIDPLYLVPFSFLFGSQSMSGFHDNSFMGLYTKWRPFNSFLLNGLIYVDDLWFNMLLRGTFFAKLAGEIGISWAPTESFLSKLDFDYTMVLPYMYTYWMLPDANRYNGGTDSTNPSGSYPNYINYTHVGRNLGPDLQPNSDRFSLRTLWNFLPNLDLTVSAHLIRHGNASEGHEKLDEKYHDGSLFDSGSSDPWRETDTYSGYHPYLVVNFLNQSVLDIRLGASIGVSWLIPTSFGTFKLIGEYGAEYGWNRVQKSGYQVYGTPVEGNNGIEHFWSVGGKYSW